MTVIGYYWYNVISNQHIGCKHLYYNNTCLLIPYVYYTGYKNFCYYILYNIISIMSTGGGLDRCSNMLSKYW